MAVWRDGMSGAIMARSSAKSKHDVRLVIIDDGRSVVHKLYSSGASLSPWGTPVVCMMVSERK